MKPICFFRRILSLFLTLSFSLPSPTLALRIRSGGLEEPNEVTRQLENLLNSGLEEGKRIELASTSSSGQMDRGDHISSYQGFDQTLKAVLHTLKWGKEPPRWAKGLAGTRHNVYDVWANTYDHFLKRYPDKKNQAQVTLSIREEVSTAGPSKWLLEIRYRDNNTHPWELPIDDAVRFFGEKGTATGSSKRGEGLHFLYWMVMNSPGAVLTVDGLDDDGRRRIVYEAPVRRKSRPIASQYREGTEIVLHLPIEAQEKSLQAFAKTVQTAMKALEERYRVVESSGIQFSYWKSRVIERVGGKAIVNNHIPARPGQIFLMMVYTQEGHERSDLKLRKNGHYLVKAGDDTTPVTVLDPWNVALPLPSDQLVHQEILVLDDTKWKKPYAQGVDSPVSIEGGQMGISWLPKKGQLVFDFWPFHIDGKLKYPTYLFYPLQLVESSSESQQSTAGLEELRLLLVDDDSDWLNFVQDFVTRRRLVGKVVTATNVNKAIQQAQDAEASGQPFDAAIIDLELPAYSLEELLRAAAGGKSLPLDVEAKGGLTLIHELNPDQRTRTVPILLLSGDQVGVTKELNAFVKANQLARYESKLNAVGVLTEFLQQVAAQRQSAGLEEHEAKFHSYIRLYQDVSRGARANQALDEARREMAQATVNAGFRTVDAAFDELRRILGRGYPFLLGPKGEFLLNDLGEFLKVHSEIQEAVKSSTGLEEGQLLTRVPLPPAEASKSLERLVEEQFKEPTISSIRVRYLIKESPPPGSGSRVFTWRTTYQTLGKGDDPGLSGKRYRRIENHMTPGFSYRIYWFPNKNRFELRPALEHLILPYWPYLILLADEIDTYWETSKKTKGQSQGTLPAFDRVYEAAKLLANLEKPLVPAEAQSSAKELPSAPSVSSDKLISWLKQGNYAPLLDFVEGLRERLPNFPKGYLKWRQARQGKPTEDMYSLEKMMPLVEALEVLQQLEHHTQAMAGSTSAGLEEVGEGDLKKRLSEIRQRDARALAREIYDTVEKEVTYKRGLEQSLRAAVQAIDRIRSRRGIPFEQFWVKTGIQGDRIFLSFRPGREPVLLWLDKRGIRDLAVGEGNVSKQIWPSSLLGGNAEPKFLPKSFQTHHPKEKWTHGVTFTAGQMLELMERNPKGRATLILTGKGKREVAIRLARGWVGRFDGDMPISFLWQFANRVDLFIDKEADPGEELRKRLMRGGFKVRFIETPEQIGEEVATNVMTQWHEKVFEEKGQFILALVTGSTPEHFLKALTRELQTLPDQQRIALLEAVVPFVPDDYVYETTPGRFKNIPPEKKFSAIAIRKRDFVIPATKGLPRKTAARLKKLLLRRLIIPKAHQVEAQMEKIPALDHFVVAAGPDGHVLMDFPNHYGRQDRRFEKEDRENVRLFDPRELIQQEMGLAGKKRIVVIQNSQEPAGVFGRSPASLGFPVEVIQAYEPSQAHLIPSDPADWDWENIQGLVVMGGPPNVFQSGTYLWLEALIRLIRFAVEHQVPSLYVCLGGQSMALAIGGEVTPDPGAPPGVTGPKGHRERGWRKVRLTRAGQKHPFFNGFEKSFLLGELHGDTIRFREGATFRTADGQERPVELLARGRQVRWQAFSVGNAVVVLGHLEFDPWEVAKRWFQVADNRKDEPGNRVMRAIQRMVDSYDKSHKSRRDLAAKNWWKMVANAKDSKRLFWVHLGPVTMNYARKNVAQLVRRLLENPEEKGFYVDLMGPRQRFVERAEVDSETKLTKWFQDYLDVVQYYQDVGYLEQVVEHWSLSGSAQKKGEAPFRSDVSFMWADLRPVATLEEEAIQKVVDLAGDRLSLSEKSRGIVKDFLKGETQRAFQEGHGLLEAAISLRSDAPESFPDEEQAQRALLAAWVAVKHGLSTLGQWEAIETYSQVWGQAIGYLQQGVDPFKQIAQRLVREGLSKPQAEKILEDASVIFSALLPTGLEELGRLYEGPLILSGGDIYDRLNSVVGSSNLSGVRVYFYKNAASDPSNPVDGPIGSARFGDFLKAAMGIGNAASKIYRVFVYHPTGKDKRGGTRYVAAVRGSITGLEEGPGKGLGAMYRREFLKPVPLAVVGMAAATGRALGPTLYDQATGSMEKLANRKPGAPEESLEGKALIDRLIRENIGGQIRGGVLDQTDVTFPMGRPMTGMSPRAADVLLLELDKKGVSPYDLLALRFKATNVGIVKMTLSLQDSKGGELEYSLGAEDWLHSTLEPDTKVAFLRVFRFPEDERTYDRFILSINDVFPADVEKEWSLRPERIFAYRTAEYEKGVQAHRRELAARGKAGWVGTGVGLAAGAAWVKHAYQQAAAQDAREEDVVKLMQEALRYFEPAYQRQRLVPYKRLRGDLILIDEVLQLRGNAKRLLDNPKRNPDDLISFLHKTAHASYQGTTLENESSEMRLAVLLGKGLLDKFGEAISGAPSLATTAGLEEIPGGDPVGVLKRITQTLRKAPQLPSEKKGQLSPVEVELLKQATEGLILIRDELLKGEATPPSDAIEAMTQFFDVLKEKRYGEVIHKTNAHLFIGIEPGLSRLSTPDVEDPPGLLDLFRVFAPWGSQDFQEFMERENLTEARRHQHSPSSQPSESSGLEEAGEGEDFGSLQGRLRSSEVTGGLGIRGRFLTGEGYTYDALVHPTFPHRLFPELATGLSPLLGRFERESQQGNRPWRWVDAAGGIGMALQEGVAQYPHMQPVLVDAVKWSRADFSDLEYVRHLEEEAKRRGIPDPFSREGIEFIQADVSRVKLDTPGAPPIRAITLFQALSYNKDPLGLLVNLYNQLSEGGVLLANLYIPTEHPRADELKLFWEGVLQYLDQGGVPVDWKFKDFREETGIDSDATIGWPEYHFGIVFRKVPGSLGLNLTAHSEPFTIKTTREVQYQVAWYEGDLRQPLILHTTGLEEGRSKVWAGWGRSFTVLRTGESLATLQGYKPEDSVPIYEWPSPKTGVKGWVRNALGLHPYIGRMAAMHLEDQLQEKRILAVQFLDGQIQYVANRPRSGLEEAETAFRRALDTLEKDSDLRNAQLLIIDQGVLENNGGLWGVLENFSPTLGLQIYIYVDNSFELEYVDQLDELRRQRNIFHFTDPSTLVDHSVGMSPAREALYYGSNSRFEELHRVAGNRLEIQLASYSDLLGFFRDFIAVLRGADRSDLTGLEEAKAQELTTLARNL